MRVEVTPPAATADRVEQSVYFVTKAGKRDLLAELLADPAFERTLVFTRTKHGADRVVKNLRAVDIHSHAIHGNKSQNNRERALEDFRSGRAPVLVATDIAARGIDVKEITHVINFDLPNIPESYVHRIGRTARAGREGIAISFCDSEEREYLRDIEKLIKQRIPVAGNLTVPQSSSRAQHAAPQRAAAASARTPDPHNPWLAEAEEPAAATRQAERHPQRPPQRQRPEPRQAPGPYLPSPPKPARETQKDGHGDRHQRPHKSRPATPNYVDPEQRRSRPPERQPQQQTQQQRRPGSSSGGSQQRTPGQRPQRRSTRR